MNRKGEDMHSTLLMVKMEKQDYAMLETILEKEYSMKKAENRDEALKILKDEFVSAVICDLSMLEHADFIQQLCSDQQLSKTPVFVWTAEEAIEEQVLAFDLGAEDVLTKPFHKQIVQSRLKKALGKQRSQIDSLTGLYNSDLFCREVVRIISKQPAGAYLLACFDIDNFQAINAQYTRELGDHVLRQVANAARDFVTPLGGLACRLSADNFMLLVPSGTPALLSERMTAIEDQLKLKGIYIKIQLSIGRYLIDDKNISINDMVNKALLAKRTVKGRYNVSIGLYNDELEKHFIEEQKIISQMEYALLNGEFEVWLQPQYNHENGAMIGAEALVRWYNSLQGNKLMMPDVFIPVFERTGFIYEMDKYVWNQVCQLLRRWLNEGSSPLPVSVNVSRVDIFQEDFYEIITGFVQTYAIPTDLLQLEITESAFSFDTLRMIKIVKKLRTYGFTVEIDDFGSGYSSFNVLKDVPADVLKLDMRFLSGEDTTGRGGNIIESVVRMAKWIGMRVIAEGVETQRQADFLYSIGCPFIQGYLYNKPMPVGEFEVLYHKGLKDRNTNIFEMINALDGNAFWNSESIESLIFNSYVGGACVVEFTDAKCEIIRANEKYREELRTNLSLTELMKTDLLVFLSQEEAQCIRLEVEKATYDGSEMRGEITFFFNGLEDSHEECLRYFGRVIAKSSVRSVVYLLFENITEQKRLQQMANETTEQLQFLNEISKSVLSKSDTKEAIESLLKKQMVYYHSDGVYVIELDEIKQTGRISYWVTADALPDQMEMAEELPYEKMRNWIEILRNDHYIVIEDANALGEERSLEKQKLLAAGITSLIAVPLRHDGALIGMLGVRQPRRALNHVGHLASLGDYVSVLLNRRDLLTKIKNDNLSMQRLMNDTPGGFVRMQLFEDGSCIPVFINDGFCELMGMNHDETVALYKENAYARVHPDDLSTLRTVVIKATQEDSVFSARVRFYHKEKGYMYFQTFYRTTTNPDGTKFINGYYANMTVEIELEERRKELLDNLPCGAIIFEVTADGIINTSHINKRYTELVNRRENELCIHNSIQAIHPEDRECMMQTINEAIRKDTEMECNIRVLKGGGGYITFHLVGRIVSRENQNTVIYTTYTLISEETRSLSIALEDQCRAEKLAQESNEQLRFLNDVSRYLLMSGNSDEAIHLILKKTLDYFDGDRTYIFELDKVKQTSSITYECSAPHIISQKENLQTIPYQIQRYALKTFRNKDTICIENVVQFIPKEVEGKQILLDHGIHSLILVPIWIGEELIGFTGVDNPKKNISHVDHLAALGDYIASIILRRNNEAQIQGDNKVLHDLMNDMPGGFVQMKIYPDGEILPIFINQEFCRMSGMTLDECMSFYEETAYAGVHPEDRESVEQELSELLVKRDTRTLRVRLSKSDGSYVPMQVFYRITDDGANNLYLNGYYTDLTEQLALEERELAEHDELTSLFNRTKLARMKNSDYQTLQSCGILFFDVNHLKTVNDTQGHNAGDSLLRLVADSIRAITGPRIHGYRYGGDEFLIVMCNGQESELLELIELWKKEMLKLAKDRAAIVTAAVGVAYSKAPFSLSALIQQADQRMYANKLKIKKGAL